MNLEACLPPELVNATITKIAAGLSGAGVYRVDADGQVFVLKISDEGAEWRGRIQQLAADAGLAPRVVHVDEARRAVVSAFVVDRSFPALFGNPQTREAALAQLGRMLRRVHELPIPAGIEANDPLELLTRIWSGLASFATPAFVGDAVRRMLDETVPARDRALVLSHNDVNPSNVVFDGERVLLLDWDMAGPNDPFYDLAAISVFLRMDDATSERLLAAHDDAPVSSLPARFRYNRRLVAVTCGVLFLHLARHGGHGGGDATLDATLALGDIYQRMRAGTLSPATADGQWLFGLALVKASVAL